MSDRMTRKDIKQIEIDLLLEAMFQLHGYDFRSYARASIERRICQFASRSGCDTVSEMIPRVLHDKEFFSRLTWYFSIVVTEMFRDPPVYRAVRQNVVPVLRTWPHFKVWHAGCATGQEVYSLAIVLKEEGLLDRATIYATDFNEEALNKAREGIYTLDEIQEFTANYQKAGGNSSFSEYYHARYGSAVMDSSLKQRITFANHNLVVDGVFGEMHLILCRNVLIYFNSELRNRALRLFTESLVHGGFLCLGTKEDIQFTDVSDSYERVGTEAKFYKKIRRGVNE